MSKEEFVFARPPNELSCIIGSLFAELNAPCEHICKNDEIVLCGTTFSGNEGVLVIRHDCCRFEVEYDKRLAFIDEALKGCNLMLQLVNISLELGYVSIKRSQHWTKLVTDVKYMSLSWKKKDSVRAESLRSAALAKEQAKEDERIARVIAAVMAKLNQDAQR